MRIQWCRQLICYIVIAILFASGMCVEIDSSHSYFACETTETSSKSQYTNSQSFLSCDYCTNELLQNNSQYIRNNSTRRIFSRKTRENISNTAASISSSQISYYEGQYLTDTIYFGSSRINIIEYIHRQDGSK